MLLDNNEPMSYGEAMVGPDSDEWLEAIKFERGSMYLMVVRLLGADGFKRKTDNNGKCHH